MARYIYGGGGDGDIIKPTGLPYTNATANVFDARTGGSQITDLQNISGGAITAITTDSFGQAVFYGPDNFIGTLWLDFGSGVRWGLSPKAVDLAAARAIAVQRAADNAAQSHTQKAYLPYNTADPLLTSLAQGLDPLVIPRFTSQAARDAAFPSPIGGDRCWRFDLACEQIYNDQINAWRNSNFAFTVGTQGVAATVKNTASETLAASASVPANLPLGATFRMTSYGIIIQAASTTPTVTFRIRVGGLSGAILASNLFDPANNVSPTNRPFYAVAHFTVMTTGTSGQWFGNLSSASSISSTSSLNDADPSERSDGTALVTKDTTVSQALALTVQWSAASNSNSVTLYNTFWERVV